jgi:hypothetical protein
MNETHKPAEGDDAASLRALMAEMKDEAAKNPQPAGEQEEDPLKNLEFDAHGPATVLEVDGLRPTLPREETPLEGPLFQREEPEDPSSRVIPRLGKVAVSDSDKDEFFRCFLQGVRCQLPVVIDAGEKPRRYVFRDLSMGEKDLCYELLQHLSKDTAPGLGNRHFNLYVQARVYLSTVREDDVKWPAAAEDFNVLDASPAEFLNVIKNHFANFFGARYAALVDAYTIFETRIVILEDAVSNSDFRKPAGTN